jgi:hypothetical protein
MEEEAIITAVDPGPQRVINESLDLAFLHVSFRALAASKYRNKINKTTLTQVSQFLTKSEKVKDFWL